MRGLLAGLRLLIGWPDTRYAVRRGAAYLDQHYPGWRARLRLTPEWHVERDDRCPLAVASGRPFWDTSEVYRRIDLGAHGFMHQGPPIRNYKHVQRSRWEWDRLQREWEREVYDQ